MSEIENTEPIIQRTAEPWETTPVNRMTARIVTTIDDIDDVAEGMDVLAAMLGRFGLDGFAVFLTDEENPERQWVVRGGELMTTEEFVARYEAAVDEAIDTDS